MTGHPTLIPNSLKYLNRIMLVAVLLFLAACEDEGCDMSGTPGCGESMTINKTVVLTPENPSIRVITDTAAFKCGAQYHVWYQWQDAPTIPGQYVHEESKGKTGVTLIPEKRVADEKSRPPIVIKFGTLEGGTIKDSDVHKPGLTPDGWWNTYCSKVYPSIKKGENALETGHFVLTVTLQQPIIKLPSVKGPTISLPFIGPVIGPKPKAVDVKLQLEFTAPEK